MFKPNSTERGILSICGVPGHIFRERPFKTEDYIRSYTDSTSKSPVQVSIKKQIKWLNDVMVDPLGDPYVMCISSEPSDLRAKMVAAEIMLSVKKNPDTVREKIRWITPVGAFRKIKEPFKLIVIDNITGNSTAQRIENVRDLLVMHPNIPRIVVTSGIKPIELFRVKLKHHLHRHLYLQSKKVQSAI